ncbi:hypothetical protein [Marinicella gelatinilytica]|uniref:hypothetical protein n=1 Tax=Marinicella gelatinilytica TaxID=2996017 RepID=UPI002260DB00|nr:hypothetical protein [Marinicella gelatinilytica]MCX7545005.1 hypothetical protein [Marinicella gelatinilytica]
MVFLPLIVLLVLMALFVRWVVAKRPGDRFYYWAWVLVMLSSFLLFWVNGAVGIIGDSNNDVNMLYSASLGLGVMGALWQRFRPLPMVYLMLILGFLQVLIAVLAWLLDWGVSGPVWPWDVWFLSIFFTLMWLMAAWLFYKSEFK